MVQFPTAFEMEYRFLLQNLREHMMESVFPFIDITLENLEVKQYLKDKGYKLLEVRYEYKDTEKGREYGFFGRTDGDGEIRLRIIWGNLEHCSKIIGDFRV